MYRGCKNCLNSEDLFVLLFFILWPNGQLFYKKKSKSSMAWGIQAFGNMAAGLAVSLVVAVYVESQDVSSGLWFFFKSDKYMLEFWKSTPICNYPMIHLVPLRYNIKILQSKDTLRPVDLIFVVFCLLFFTYNFLVFSLSFFLLNIEIYICLIILFC